MIPKTLHYCWFGGQPEPEAVKRYIDGWRRLMPGWQVVRWDETNFPAASFTYAAEALAMKNWAFVADVARMWALWNHGGVYLDTDMELLAPLDPFLADRSFLGEEQGVALMGIVGAEPRTPWTGRFLDFYRSTHFVNIWGHPVRTPNPVLFSRHILPALAPGERPRVYPREVFYPPLLPDGSAATTPATVGIHHYEASWRRGRTLATRLRTIARGLRVRWLPTGKTANKATR